MKDDSVSQLELVESDIWDVVRRSIASEALVSVMESATRIAAAHPNVLSVGEIAELLVDAAIAARLPIDVGGLPLTARGLEHPPAALREVAASGTITARPPNDDPLSIGRRFDFLRAQGVPAKIKVRSRTNPTI